MAVAIPASALRSYGRPHAILGTRVGVNVHIRAAMRGRHHDMSVREACAGQQRGEAAWWRPSTHTRLRARSRAGLEQRWRRRSLRPATGGSGSGQHADQSNRPAENLYGRGTRRVWLPGTPKAVTKRCRGGEGIDLQTRLLVGGADASMAGRASPCRCRCRTL